MTRSEMETLLKSIDTRVAGLDTRLTSLDTRVAGLETRVASLDDRVAGIDDRLKNVDLRTSRIEQILPTIAAKEDVRNLREEFHRLEPGFVAFERAMDGKFAALEDSLGSRIEDSRRETRVIIEDVRADIIRVLDARIEDSRRETRVLIEDVRGDIRLLAEHLAAALERQHPN